MSPTRRRAAVGALAALLLAAPALAHAGPPGTSPTGGHRQAAHGPATGSARAGPPATPPAGPAPGLRFVAPVVDPVLTRGFDPPVRRWSAGHRGVDLVVEPGATVLAPGPGRVTFVGRVVDRGVVTVAHEDGLRSSLEPVVGEVAVGERVRAGDRLGEVAPAGGHCARAGCLHWGVRDGDRYVDPLTLLPDAGPVVLLPLVPGR